MITLYVSGFGISAFAPKKNRDEVVIRVLANTEGVCLESFQIAGLALVIVLIS